MTYLICSFAIAFIATLLLVRSATAHAHLSGDTDKQQPQKFHTRVVPRIGGIGIVAGVLGAGLMALTRSSPEWPLLLGLLAASALAFGAGLVEDFTKKVSPAQRLLATAASAVVAAVMLDAQIFFTTDPDLDTLLDITGVTLLLTLLAVTGVANSVNIIDGFNGLASMCAAIMFAAIGYVAFQVGDTAIMHCALAGLGAALGFFVWNYPLGLIFLGDGGAYFLGFWIAELSILLVVRNAQAVSPLFPLLLCAYPVFETLFTMYRRRVIRGRSVSLPDATHLHSLVYRRLMRWAIGKRDAANLLRRNSMTSPYLWVLCSVPATTAAWYWNDTEAIALLLGGFCLIYLLVYRAIVRFRTPRVLLRRSQRWAADTAEHHDHTPVHEG